MSYPASPVDPGTSGKALYLPDTPFTSLPAGTAAGTATYAYVAEFAQPRTNFGLTVGTSGTVASFTVTLYGSADGTNFSSMGTATAVGTSWITSKPVKFARADLTAVSLTAGGHVTAAFVATI